MKNVKVIVFTLVATVLCYLSIGWDDRALTTLSLKELKTATGAYTDRMLVIDGNTYEPKLSTLSALSAIGQVTVAYTAYGIDHYATAVQTSVEKSGDIIKTTIAIDIAGLKSITTTGDIIGDGTQTAYIIQITTANNGVIYKGEVNCGEVPTTGDDDIDIYSATEGTGVYDGAIGDLTETALVTSAGAYAIGTAKPFTALPVANSYLYLTTGDTTAGTYDAGKIFIELWGTVE